MDTCLVKKEVGGRGFGNTWKNRNCVEWELWMQFGPVEMTTYEREKNTLW